MNCERTIEFLPPEKGFPPGFDPPSRQTGSRSRGAESVVEVTVLDTFDRRLFHCGKVFTVERVASGPSGCVLREMGAQRAGQCADLPSAALPRFAWEVPDGPIRSALEAIVEVRALLPLCRLRRLRYPIREWPDAMPSEVRVFWNRYFLIPAHGRPREISGRFAVSWSTEDDKPVRRFVEALLERGILAPVKDDIWLEALERAGQVPGATEPVRRPELTPELRADLALRRILSSLFEIMGKNEAGIIDNIDSEFLHDFRVAIRRSRAALSQMKGVFPVRVIERHVRELGWLGEITGPVRDLDVYLLDFSKFQDLLPAALRHDLEPLRALLLSKSQAAHAALARSLTSSRYRRFQTQWVAFLERPVPRRPTASNALQTIESLGAQRIWRLYRRVSKSAAEIDEDTPAERIHALRKLCKKLRYLMEFLQAFHEPDKIRRPIKDLKVLQDHLGAFQDAEVQIGHLLAWFSELRQDPHVSSQTLLAVGVLFGRFDQVQQSRRAKIPGALRHFARKEGRIRFKALFKAAAEERSENDRTKPAGD